MDKLLEKTMERIQELEAENAELRRKMEKIERFMEVSSIQQMAATEGLQYCVQAFRYMDMDLVKKFSRIEEQFEKIGAQDVSTNL